LCRVNRLATEGIARNMFVTIFLALFDAKRRKLFLSSAGHLPMLVYRAAERKVYRVNPPGLPVGLVLPAGAGFDEKIKVEELTLKKGDFFLLFTDGIVEAADGEGRRFGLERLVQTVEHSAELSAEALMGRLKTELADFVGPSGWGDDVTALVVKDKADKAETKDVGLEEGLNGTNIRIPETRTQAELFAAQEKG
jgi:sigma-B regulation protein RsbU (phosphoserine phosphatase)